MNPIKLALKNITKLNKFIFIFINLCPWLLGCGGDSPNSSILRAGYKIDNPDAYNAFLKFAEAQKDAEGLHLFFFKVGHGNFILVRDKDCAMIVDAGSHNTDSIKGYIQELFLACLGEAHLSQIIITHNHEDHTNYVEDVKKWANNAEIQKINVFKDQNPFYSTRVISFHTPLSVITDVALSFLQPLTKITTKNKNDKSSVFVLTYQGIKVLFTGDATGLSLDNYVEKHQEGDNAIVDANRELLKNIHLFVMPHHGSSTEDSFRWTLYVTKHSPNLLASVICGDPFVDKYKDVRNWVRDISWPDSMRNRDINNLIYYWSARSEVHKKQTNTALFITGAESCRCVYFKIQNRKLYKYDSTKKDFVLLDGHNAGLQPEDFYDAGEKVIQENAMEEVENTTEGMMQMINPPMGGGRFSMNRSPQKMEKEEEIEISGIEQKEMKEEKPDSDDMSEDDDEENGMKEEKDMSSAFPSNVYKFQDAFDDNNDYMAYAS